MIYVAYWVIPLIVGIIGFVLIIIGLYLALSDEATVEAIRRWLGD